MERSNLVESLVAGASGAAAVTILHESARHKLLQAPGMDLVGERALKRILKHSGLRAPRGKALYRWALAGELVSNAAFFALAGAGAPTRPLLRGLSLGALAGVGALTLTPKLGLGTRPVRRSRATAAMTFSWYLLGGLVAGAVQQFLSPGREHGLFRRR